MYFITTLLAIFLMASQPEVYDIDTPFARIEGTNYVIHANDTLLIKKSVRVDYTYQVLKKSEKRKLHLKLKKCR